MKDIINKINEGKYCRLFSEVQTETNKNAEYHTFNISDGQKKFKKGFLTFVGTENFFTITAFNNSKDFAELVGSDEDAYDEYDSIKIGEFKTIDKGHPEETNILRIW